MKWLGLAVVLALTALAGSVRAQVATTGDVNPSPAVSPNWNVFDGLYVGYNGAGTLSINSGGTVTVYSDSHIGLLAGSTGGATVSGTGSKWNNYGGLYVGHGDAGTLDINSGGTVTSDNGYIGLVAGSTGVATVSGAGSSWTVSGSGGELYVGYGDAGTLDINSGGTVTSGGAYIGLTAGSSGIVTVSGAGSRWTVNDYSSSRLYVGYGDAGTLSVIDGGQVVVGSGSGTLNLGSVNGTLNIGNGGAAGILNAAEVHGGAGTATLNFNHNETAYHFTSDGTSTGNAISITGSTAVRQIGSGTTILTGANTYTGATTVTAGALAVNGSIKNSAITLNGGTLRYNSAEEYTGDFTFTSGSLGGTNLRGSLGGLTIGSNQTLSPGNSPGTAETTGLIWGIDGSYLWELNNATGTAGAGSGWDLVNGSGILNVTSESGSEFNILITSLTSLNAAGLAENFNDAVSYNWLIADFDSVTNFAVDAITIDTSAFLNSFTGTFGVALGGDALPGDNSQIYLTYTAIPEPSSAVALLVGLSGLLPLYRRRPREGNL